MVKHLSRSLHQHSLMSSGHASRSLISLTGETRNSLPRHNLLLLLNKGTAVAAKAVETVRKMIAFDVVGFADFVTLEEREEPGETAAVCSGRWLDGDHRAAGKG